MNFRTLSLSALLAVLMFACAGVSTEEAIREAKDPVLVNVAVLTEVSLPQSVPLMGVVRPRRQTTIASRVMAYVTAVAVEEGQRVSIGQPLITLNDEDLEAGAAAARAMEDAAESAILGAQHATGSAESQLALARATHERYATLLAKESASQQEYDVAEAGLRAAEAAVEQARAQTVQAEARRSQAVAQITSADTMQGYASIAAPINGVVTARLVDPGDLANPGMPLFEIEQTSEYRLEVPVPESLIATVRVGQELPVAIDALGQSGPEMGRIAQIDRAATDASRTFLVKVAVGSSPNLRTGLYGRLFLPTNEQVVLRVPAGAVVERGQLRSVFTVEDGAAQRRLVTLGQLADGHYEVLSGLDAGERVVLQPSAVTDGSAVEERR
jgi:RND family efflux transporter MFP subunit